jgi:hypothetical protein
MLLYIILLSSMFHSIPKDKAVVDKEWNKLDDRGFVDWTSIEEKRIIVDEAKRLKRQVTLARSWRLSWEACWTIPSRRAQAVQNCFQGGSVKDEQGYVAAFSEQGTSASHLEAAKMIASQTILTWL